VEIFSHQLIFELHSSWPINAILKPGFNRAPLDHKHIDFYPSDSVHGFDDEVSDG
jgi:hypothetical protein